MVVKVFERDQPACQSRPVARACNTCTSHLAPRTSHLTPHAMPGPGEMFTREQVQAHTRREDAFLIIDNVVYDVTSFLDDHPGGAEILLDNAGKDASKCFREVGHSDDARAWRARFAVGELVPEERWEVVRGEPSREGGGEGLSLRGFVVALGPILVVATISILVFALFF